MRCTFLTTLLSVLVIGGALQTSPCDRAATRKAGAMGVIKGTVRDAEGRAVGGAFVRVEGQNLRRQAESDADGGYEFELPPGSYRVVVERAGFRTSRGAELSLKSAAVETVEVRLDTLTPPPAASQTPASPSAPADFIEIDFGLCRPERRRVDLTYGSATYEIVGTNGDTCTMRYGKETENPSAGPALDKTCEVPTSLGARKFKKGDAGIDLSSVDQYCKQGPGNR